MKNNEYYPYFDLLRIALAIMVMLSHDKIIAWPPAGKLAVDVFFSLSGWLIGNILLSTKLNELPRFYFNRAIRIWVPYFLALLFLLVPSFLRDPIDMKWLEFVIYKFTWVYNIFGTVQLAECKQCMPLDGIGNHFWSINAEEQFYLLAPLLLVIFPKIGKRITLWVLLCSALLSLAVYAPLSLGVLAALLNAKYREFYQIKEVKIILLITLILCSYGVSFATSFRSLEFELYSPFFAISLVLLLAIRGTKNSIWVILGGMSYPLYLNHWFGIVSLNVIFEKLGWDFIILRQGLSIALNLTIAFLLYWFIDRQLVSKRNYLFNKRRASIITFVAYFSIICGLLFGINEVASTSTNRISFYILFIIFFAASLTTITKLRKT